MKMWYEETGMKMWYEEAGMKMWYEGKGREYKEVYVDGVGSNRKN